MQLVEVLHVVGAIFLVGPVVGAGMYAPRLLREGSRDGLALVSRTSLVFGVGAVLVGLLGFGLVSSDNGPGFDTAWVIASIVLWFVASALTLGVLVPTLNAVGEALDAGAPVPDTAKSRVMIGAMVPSTLYLIVTILMVTTPGA